MSIEIKVPQLPESVNDALIINWHKQPGETVKQDELLVELETDKVVLEVPAPADGVLGSILLGAGETVIGDQVLGMMNEGAVEMPDRESAGSQEGKVASAHPQISPAVRKLLAEQGLTADGMTGTGKHGRLLKEDVQSYIDTQKANAMKRVPDTQLLTEKDVKPDESERLEKRVPMTRLRARIAERLLEAKQSTAMLTTFNEVNMEPMIKLRADYKERFEKTHGARLGFMSIFVKAATVSLLRFPEVNASLDGEDVIYHGYCDVGIAISSQRGLVVPIMRNAELMSMADIESSIVSYAEMAREDKLGIEDLMGGTFTITNGGVFGSLLSTPILNPPQSAILGMHSIQKRPVVEHDEIVIRPMMYLALSYDHRIIDGKSAVIFLKTIKELVEDPARLLLDV
ncbi:MAG: 2-oxoglutarate dehydrogenase complex dihydrolipoyllysine-residue succinyltransferase [Gammaproteobacteria bacterium]